MKPIIILRTILREEVIVTINVECYPQLAATGVLEMSFGRAKLFKSLYSVVANEMVCSLYVVGRKVVEK